MQKLLHSIEDVGELTGLSRSKIYELIAAQQLEACKIDRRTFVTHRGLEALIERGIADAQKAWSA